MQRGHKNRLREIQKRAKESHVPKSKLGAEAPEVRADNTAITPSGELAQKNVGMVPPQEKPGESEKGTSTTKSNTASSTNACSSNNSNQSSNKEGGSVTSSRLLCNKIDIPVTDLFIIDTPEEPHDLVPEKQPHVRLLSRPATMNFATWLRIGRAHILILEGSNEDMRQIFVKKFCSELNWPLYIPKQNEDPVKALIFAREQRALFYYPNRMIYENTGRSILAMLSMMDQLQTQMMKDVPRTIESSFGMIISGNANFIQADPISRHAHHLDLYYSRPVYIKAD